MGGAANGAPAVGPGVLGSSAALPVAWPVAVMRPWSGVPVAALAAGLRALLPLRVAAWSTAPPLVPTEPGKGWFAAPAPTLLSMTGLWARRIRLFPMGLTVPEHPPADPR
jgi:hypothetical protein